MTKESRKEKSQPISAPVPASYQKAPVQFTDWAMI